MANRQINEIQKNKATTAMFGGINEKPYCPDGQFAALVNVTHGNYPVLSSVDNDPKRVDDIRNNSLGYGRCVYSVAEDGDAVFSLIGERDSDGSYSVMPHQLSKKSKTINGSTEGYYPYTVDRLMSDKRGLNAKNTDSIHITNFGAYIVYTVLNKKVKDGRYDNDSSICYAKKLYTEDETPVYALLSRSAISASNVSMYTCDSDGNRLTVTYSATEPSSPTDMQYWMNIADADNPVLMRYSTVMHQWSVIKAYTGIEFETGSYPPHSLFLNDLLHVAASVDDFAKFGKDRNYVKIVKLTEGNYTKIVLDNVLLKANHSSANISFWRDIPVIDGVMECNNRLWSCHSGIINGEYINEIYASQLGSFTNWYAYEGLAGDSYAATIGVAGKFTGMAVLNNRPVFLKEGNIIKVYGDYPANYQVITQRTNGCINADTLVGTGDRIYYAGRDGIYCYDDATARNISQSLDYNPDKFEYDGRAAVFNERYYISSSDGIIYVYDIKKDMWSTRTSLKGKQILQICEVYNNLCAVMRDGADTQLYILEKSVGHSFEDLTDVAEPAEFDIVTGLYTFDPYASYLSKIDLRYSLEFGGNIFIEVAYDGNENWEESDWQPVYSEDGKETINNRHTELRLTRSDAFRLRIRGRGKFNLYSITKTVERGSDV